MWHPLAGTEDPLQTTIRGIPEDLEHALRERARRSGESPNRTIIRLLGEAVGLKPPRKKRDLSRPGRNLEPRGSR